MRNDNIYQTRCKMCVNLISYYAEKGIYIQSNQQAMALENKRKSLDKTLIKSLSKKYGKYEIWVANGLEACRRCGLGHDYFIERYLKGNKSIPKNDLIDDAFRDVLLEQRCY